MSNEIELLKEDRARMNDALLVLMAWNRTELKIPLERSLQAELDKALADRQKLQSRIQGLTGFMY